MEPKSEFTTEAFRLLVDKASQQSALDSEVDVVGRFGVQFESVQPAARWQALYEVIKAGTCIPEPGEAAFDVLRRLRRAVVYEDVLGLDPEPYAGILRVLADASREGAARPFEDEEFWLEAIDAARSVRTLSGDLPESNPREAVVVAAAKRLVAGGARLEVQDSRLAFATGELDRLAQAVDRRAAALGGLVVLEQTLAHLIAIEPLEFGRYAPGRSFGRERNRPSFPLGYLLQLGVKHVNSPPALLSRRPLIWRELAQQAVDLCAVLDVEPYLNLEDIFAGAADLPRYLASVTLFDHIYALKQWPPSRGADLLRGVTAGLDPAEVRSRVGWNLSDVLVLLNAVLSLASQPMTIITPKQLEEVGVSRETWRALQGSFVHPVGGVNKGYVSPSDADKAEFDFKPMVGLPRDHLLVSTPGLAALGFYEATTRALRDAGYPDLDRLLGDAVEAVVADALRAARQNVSVESVEYVARGGSSAKPTGECDVVVETENLVVLIELKKKPLRRASATGDAAPGLVDLSTSLFAAQAQLGRHERTLLRDGELAFVNGYTLKLGDRRVERIAMTWLDYGGLQDKLLLSQLFEGLMGRRLTTDHPKEGPKLRKLNAVIEALEQEVEDLRRLGKDERAPFMNCWFLSVPQLLMLIDGVEQPAEFEKRVRSLRHMSYRTLDFYRDFGFARRTGLI